MAGFLGRHDALVIVEILVYLSWIMVGAAGDFLGQQALVVEQQDLILVRNRATQVKDHPSMRQDLVGVKSVVLLDPAGNGCRRDYF